MPDDSGRQSKLAEKSCRVMWVKVFSLLRNKPLVQRNQ